MTDTAISSAAMGGGAAATCSARSRQAGLPLAGSAGCYDAILAFELAPPWTARLVGSRASTPALDDFLAEVAGSRPGLRVVAMEPIGANREIEIAWFERGRGPFAGYAERRYRCHPDDLARALAALAEGDAAALGEAVRPRPAPAADAAPVGRAASRTLLVCTHGSRDACCGKLGFPLYRELLRAGAGTGVEVRRSSHLGGHRFAATLLDLPSGRTFGRLEPGDAETILDLSRATPAWIAAHGRGCCAFTEAAQVVEQEAWMHHGEAWRIATIECEVGGEAPAHSVSLSAVSDAGVALTWLGRVALSPEPLASVPASCDRDPEPHRAWIAQGGASSVAAAPAVVSPSGGATA